MGGFGGFAPPQGFQATSVTSAAFPLRAPNGTKSVPSYAFSASTDTGVYLGAVSSGVVITSAATNIAIFAAGVGVRVDSGLNIGFASGDADSTSLDAYFSRDGSGIIAQKNGANAQILNIYNTFTNSSNYERGVMSWSGNALHIGAENAGTGASRDIFIVINSANKWKFDGSLFGLVSAGNFRFAHGTSALATNATEGFFHLQSCAGTPNGTPDTIPTGQVPMVYDSTNNKLYIYAGGAWKRGQVAAVDTIWA